ncbi:thioesterase II family protein [Streptomyces sp. RKAG337]|uniref:thioesterase II family protein n=1 Tax=Streptomyces sp. RKAG337 TaxID=2893404 RepID=UPI002033B152|nr:alpha/beta fold hydrolase [Streptomyces sp. RKAG337]MCM2427006.1 alpha/beta fold hydrolase [Streptomyces sp. RKAG337]
MTESFFNGAPWVRQFHPVPDAQSRLFCFAHAGGSASFFFPLSRDLSPGVEVLSVQYPGRQDRRTEPNIPDMGELADRAAEALLPFADRPFALFGHSMGATLAYEVARRLQAAGARASALFVSGRRAPHRVVDDGLHLLSDRELVDDILALDGTGSRMFGDPEMLEMVLPSIRSDYRAAETYRYVPGPLLDCPVHALTGFSDPRVEVQELHHWGEHTTGPFDLQVFSGGHFYLTANQPAITQAVSDGMARATAAR